jgi:hypothetical protein
MSTKIVLNIHSPDANTHKVDALVKLRDSLGAIHGISYTDTAGVATFNMPGGSTTDIRGNVIDLKKHMWATIDGLGQIPNFDVADSGTTTGVVVFDSRVNQMAASATFVDS